jgi:hypothetical protein
VQNSANPRINNKGISGRNRTQSSVGLRFHVPSWLFLNLTSLSQGITPAFFVASSQSGLSLLTKKDLAQIALVIS